MTNRYLRGAGVGIAQVGEIDLTNILAQQREEALGRLRNDADIRKAQVEQGYRMQELGSEQESRATLQTGLLASEKERAQIGGKYRVQAAQVLAGSRERAAATRAGGSKQSVVQAPLTGDTGLPMLDQNGKPILAPHVIVKDAQGKQYLQRLELAPPTAQVTPVMQPAGGLGPEEGPQDTNAAQADNALVGGD